MLPKDDSAVRSLWATSKSWLTIERLVCTHAHVLAEFEANLIKISSMPDAAFPMGKHSNYIFCVSQQ